MNQCCTLFLNTIVNQEPQPIQPVECRACRRKIFYRRAEQQFARADHENPHLDFQNEGWIIAEANYIE